MFEAEITYPVAGYLFAELQIDRLIKAKPNDTADLQLFRIYEITKPINGIVTVKCEHISYALSSFPVMDVFCTGTASQAVAAVLAKANAYLSSANPFSVGVTSADTIRSFNYRVGSARAALGGSDGSVLDTYGGEYEWDNYTVKLHEQRGKDTGVIVAYRKNMTDLKVTTSLENAYTAIFPYAIKDDALITVSGGRIDVENKSGIAERILIRDFSGDFDSEETVDAGTLRSKANAYLNENDINAPDVSITVSFVHLWQSPEYADLAALERVSLCDWVTVRHDILGVDVKAQVIKTEYDCIAERYVKIELGSARATFQDTLQKTIHDVTKLLQSTDTSAITQAYMQAIADATALITGADGGYVHLIPSQNPQEIVISDVENYTSSSAKVWRWNKNGLGYSSTGYSGTYTTAITKDGKINASMITTGSINASLITAGVLQSADGEAAFDLENGNIFTKHNFGSYTTEARMTTGAYRLLFNGGEIGALGTMSDGNPIIYFNNSNASKLVIGGGSDGVAEGKVVVEYEGTRFHGATNGNVCQIKDGGIYGNLHGIVYGTLNGDIYKDSGNIYFTIGGTTHGYINPEKGYIGRLDSFETWKKGNYLQNDTKLWTAINSKAATSHTHTFEDISGEKAVLKYLYAGKSFNDYRGYFYDSGDGIALRTQSDALKIFFTIGGAAVGNIDKYGYNGQVNASSTETIKRNIDKCPSVLSLFEDSKIYTFNYLKDPSNPNDGIRAKRSTGFIVERETPNEVISESGDSIDLYSMTSIIWKATQELLLKIQTLEETVYAKTN